MKSKEQVERKLDIIAQKIVYLEDRKRTPEIEREVDENIGYRNALHWVLS